MKTEQNLGVRRGDLLDCRNDLRATVGDRVAVVEVSNPAARTDDYIARAVEMLDRARGGAWNGTYTHGIGLGVVTEAARGRCAVQIEQFPSDLD